MKILKHGNWKNKVCEEKKVIFNCSVCGCEFEAGKSEYKFYAERRLNGASYKYMKCPECGSQCELKL